MASLDVRRPAAMEQLAVLGRDMQIDTLPVVAGQLPPQIAKRALEAGCAGVISSGLEVARMRSSLGSKLLIISPGIRPVDNTTTDDQKRIVTPRAAFEAGADYIVVGRPIRNAADPRAAALAIQAEIASVFA